MKKFLISILMVLLQMSAFSQYKFTLNIKSQTLSGKNIRLDIFNNTNFTPIKFETFSIKNGYYILQGEVKQPSNFAEFSISYQGKNVYKDFVLDSGVNNINLELPVGSSRYLTFRSDARGYFIFDDLNNLFEETIACYKNPARVNGYLKLTQEQHDEINIIQLKRLEAYPDDFGSLIYLFRISRADAEPAYAKNNLATFAKFSDEIRNSEAGKQLYEENTALINNKAATRAGNEVKVFIITDINDKSFSNSFLKGKPYIIVFSATWCGPCQDQLPRLKNLYDKYKQNGLKVIYFNDDDDTKRWKDHVSKNKLTWINVSEKLKANKSKIPKSFGVYAIPTCLVIDRKGTIVYNSDQSDTSLIEIEKYIKQVVYN